MPIVDAVLAEVEHESPATLKVLERVPNGDLDWAPHAKYHHRGQLSVYLRLLDVPVPAIYGVSADENPFA